MNLLLQKNKNFFLYLVYGVAVLCLVRLLVMMITANVCESIPESHKLEYMTHVLKGIPFYIMESLVFLCPSWLIFKKIKSISNQSLFWIIAGLHVLFISLINGFRIYNIGELLIRIFQVAEILLCITQFVIFVLIPFGKYRKAGSVFNQRLKTYLHIFGDCIVYAICLVVFYFSAVLIIFALCDGLYLNFDEYGDIYSDLGPAGAWFFFYIVIPIVFILSTFVMNMIKKTIDDEMKEQMINN